MKIHSKQAHLSIALIALASSSVSAARAAAPARAPATPSPTPRASLPMARGAFEPTWDSLRRSYQSPEWFRDAKFGIWAHWTAQCVPEQGDWYARHMYEEGSAHYKFHVANYGHPSKFGFKDLDNLWRAENWRPERLMALYKKAGARYFVSLANHHDNFDAYNSKYQPWNSVNIGPHKDIVGGWARAARAQGLRFGVSIHAAHAWSWLEVAQGADKSGPLQGVPYDGKLTKADGKGLWWQGYDPQDLYAQNHAPGQKLVWDWNAAAGSSVPDQAYIDKFTNRTFDLINSYRPDLVYFDDSVLPLWPISDAGLRIAAHLYNSSKSWHGRNEAIMSAKGLNDEQRQAITLDIERGKSDRIEPRPWQTDTCIGDWHYNRAVFEAHRYKTAAQVVAMLADIVSKNGNLLLSIPLRADGTIDSDEEKFLADMGRWMQINGEAIYGTRPWKVSGEGAPEARSGNFNENRARGYSAQDIRFTTRGSTLYAIALSWPQDGKLRIKTLGATQNIRGAVSSARLLGSPQKLSWAREADALVITLPTRQSGEYAWPIKIEGLDLAASQPVPIVPAAPMVKASPTGAFALDAGLAELHGALQAESRGAASNIGFWDSPSDFASWTLDAQPGIYNITARLATISEGSQFTVEVDGQKLAGTAPNTGAWEAYRDVALGQIEIKSAGKMTLSLRPLDAAHWKAINLASLKLERAPQTVP